jgi:hypothetical protein
MNEFDPRSWTGVLGFEDGAWGGGNEIITDSGGAPNDFLMEGNVIIDAEALKSLSWSNSKVRRRFLIEVQGSSGKPAGGAKVTLHSASGKTVQATAGTNGQAVVELTFTDSDYKQPWELATSNGAAASLSFFTSTPVVARP